MPYAPEGFLLDEILEVDEEQSLVRVRMPTHDDLPITNTQRADPVRHPRHVSGGLMVHMTGMAAFVHAYELLGLRHAEGWIGYGVRIHDARFFTLSTPGEPIEIECKAVRNRRLGDKIMTRYAFRFEQAGELVYQSEQTAMWLKGAH
ncbi:MAG: hypothetical protein P1V51_15465 [Deltaproteobacteria bacterium]|nr:hypothetical protein [Deltaproteobacteria bacterium]